MAFSLCVFIFFDQRLNIIFFDYKKRLEINWSGGGIEIDLFVRVNEDISRMSLK